MPAPESCGELRQRDEIRVDAAGRVEGKAHRADDPILGEQWDGERAVGILRQPRPVRKLPLELLARVGERRLAGSRRLGDGCPGLQWQAKAGRQGRAPAAAGIDDDELAVVDEAQGAADGAEERRHPFDEGVRHLVGRGSRRELRGQRTKGVSLRLDLVRTRCC